MTSSGLPPTEQPTLPQTLPQTLDASVQTGEVVPNLGAERPTPAVAAGFRKDIQGLRGFAVLLVVVEHYVGHPRGAFVGLEFFFVISGFLITGLLLREAERSSSVSIRAFYQRRIRRIFPAAMVTLALTVIVGKLLVSTGRYHDIRTDAWWTFGFLSNWHFIHNGTDYFHQTITSVSPVRHYWSLSVEEQWYVVWPLVVLSVAALTRWQARRRAEREAGAGDGAGAGPVRAPSVSTRVAVIAAVLGVASFAWATYDSHVDPTAAYFSTFTRAWEIAVGAFLAAIASRLGHLPARVRTLMGVVGIVGILVSTVLLDPDVGFPAPTGALPVLSAGLVIAAGTGVPGLAATRVLTFGVWQYFGRVSYSLYLVHWPILIYGLVILPDEDWRFYALTISSTIVATLLMHHLVEMPVLRSRFLLPWKSPKGERATSAPRRRWLHPHNVLVAGVAGALIVALAVVGRLGPAPESAAAAISAIDKARVITDQPGADQLQAGLKKALAATSYPKRLSPPLGDAEAGKAKQFAPSAQCLSPDNITKVSNCLYGPKSATKKVVVVGDSIAISYMPGIIDALKGKGWAVQGIALSSCPFTDVQMVLSYSATDQKRCNTSHDKVYAQVKRLKPDLVVIADSSAGIQRLKSGNRDAAAQAEWLKGEKKAINKIKAPGRDIVILAPNPLGPDPADCYSKVSKPKACVTFPASFWFSKKNAEQQAARATGVRYVNTINWFCYKSRCPIFGLGLTMRWDGSHITSAWSEMLSTRFRKALLPGSA